MSIGLSVIIPTMNRCRSLLETLEGLRACELPPDEIVVVDQSTDPTVRQEIKASLSAIPSVVLVQLDKPSLTHARNVGIEKASHEIVVCMDDDVTVRSDTMANVRGIMADGKVAMIAGLDLNSRREKNRMGYVFLRKSFAKRHKGHVSLGMYGRFPKSVEGRVSTEWAMGFFFVIRRSIALQDNILWDENLVSYAYAEDLDFSYRYQLAAARRGLSCIIDPLVAVYHNVSTEWRETSRAVTFMEIMDREYMTYKWGLSFWRRLCTRWANVGTFLLRVVRRDHPWDVVKAQYFCDLHRHEIRRGNLLTEMYVTAGKQGKKDG